MKFKQLIIILPIALFGCSESKDIPQGKSMSLTDSKTTTCQLIEKEFVNKGGKVTQYKELYLRCSIQDYFIKLCEGNVAATQLKPYINLGIEVEMEIKEEGLSEEDVEEILTLVKSQLEGDKKPSARVLPDSKLAVRLN